MILPFFNVVDYQRPNSMMLVDSRNENNMMDQVISITYTALLSRLQQICVECVGNLFTLEHSPVS